MLLLLSALPAVISGPREWVQAMAEPTEFKNLQLKDNDYSENKQLIKKCLGLSRSSPRQFPEFWMISAEEIESSKSDQPIDAMVQRTRRPDQSGRRARKMLDSHQSDSV